MKKKLVYIAHPFGDQSANLVKAAAVVRDILLNRPEITPIFMPLMYRNSLNDSVRSERERAMVACLNIIERVDELWCFGSEISPGIELEIEWARRLGVPVLYPEGRK